MMVVAVRTIRNVYLGGCSTSIHRGTFLRTTQRNIFHAGCLLIGAVASSETLAAFRRLEFEKLGIVQPFEQAEGEILPRLQKAASGEPFEAIIAWDNLFFITDGKVMLEPDPVLNFHAIGDGAAYALGTLCITVPIPPDKRLHVALNAAQRFVPTVREPFFVECSLSHSQILERQL